MKRIPTKADLLAALEAKRAKRERVRESWRRRGHLKVTPDMVRAIRAEYAAGGVSQKALATKFGINQGYVARIIKRTIFPNVD